MKFAISAAISAVLFSGAVAAQEVKQLTQDEAVAFLKGKELDGVNPRWSARFSFKDDGSLSGSGSAGSDSGTYTIEEGQLCLKWTRRWQSKCGRLIKVTDGPVSQILDDGSVWVTFKN
jgi:hypothetical protein